MIVLISNSFFFRNDDLHDGFKTPILKEVTSLTGLASKLEASDGGPEFRRIMSFLSMQDRINLMLSSGELCRLISIYYPGFVLDVEDYFPLPQFFFDCCDVRIDVSLFVDLDEERKVPLLIFPPRLTDEMLTYIHTLSNRISRIWLTDAVLFRYAKSLKLTNLHYIEVHWLWTNDVSSELASFIADNAATLKTLVLKALPIKTNFNLRCNLPELETLDVTQCLQVIPAIIPLAPKLKVSF